MAEQIGIIIDSEPGGMARVQTDRKGGCGGCHTNGGGGCRSCLAGSKMEIRAANAIGARSGDVVKLSLRSADFLKGAAMLYIVPILALMIGALIGAWLGRHIGWQETTGSIIGAVAGLAAAVYLLIRLDRSQWTRYRLAPTITAVVYHEGPSTPQPVSSHHACCD